MIFIDLTKAFDWVHREGLWKILKNIGCPQKFINIIRFFHEGMLGCVLDNSELLSVSLTVPNRDVCLPHCCSVFSFQ